MKLRNLIEAWQRRQVPCWRGRLVHPMGDHGLKAGVVQALALILAIGVVWGIVPKAAAQDDRNERTSAPASRVIAIGPNAAEIICALGACEAIIGVDNFTLYPPELTERVRVGGLFDPDLERIVALRPDLVVLRGRNESLETLCQTLDVPLYLDRTEALDDIPKCIADLGRMLHREGAAAELTRAFEERLASIKKRVNNRPRPRVLLTVSRQPDRMSDILTAGKGVFLSEMLEIAGGENVYGDIDMGYPQISAEGIVTRRPEVIIELMPEVILTPTLEARIRSDWRKLGPIPAVQRNRVHIITDDHCLIPSPRYVEIIDKVSRLLHGEIDSDAAGHTTADIDGR
jgi:iron complex transport system substrate-binding protein